jgi:alanine racemase
VLASEAEEFLAKLAHLPMLRLGSVYTHFPDADADDLSFAEGQVERFTALLKRLEARGIRPARVHAANSAGAVNLPDSHFDWLRVGLLAYGYRPPHCDTPIDLAPVMSFKSHLVQVRALPAAPRSAMDAPGRPPLRRRSVWSPWATGTATPGCSPTADTCWFAANACRSWGA